MLVEQLGAVEYVGHWVEGKKILCTSFLIIKMS